MDEACKKQPHTNEFEIVLFGPGYGESILLHVGGGRWVVIDSCLDGSKNPVSLEYLTQIGVEPSGAIKAVIATHWDEDHIRGMTSILQRCPDAEFCCAGAFDRRSTNSMRAAL